MIGYMDSISICCEILTFCMTKRNVHQGGGSVFFSQSQRQSCARAAQEVLGDPCSCEFSGLQPTERAHSLRRLRGAWRDPQRGRNPDVRSGQTRQRFVNFRRPYFCALIVPNLIGLARKFAPGISLQIVNVGTELAQASISRELTCAKRVRQNPGRFRSEVLFMMRSLGNRHHHLLLKNRSTCHLPRLAPLAIGIARQPTNRVSRCAQRSRASRNPGERR